MQDSHAAGGGTGATGPNSSSPSADSSHNQPQSLRRGLDGPRRVSRPITQAVPATPTAGPIAESVPAGGSTATPFHYQRRQLRRQPSRRRLWIKRGILACAGLFLVVSVFLGVKAFLATRRIITRNVTGGAPALAGNTSPSQLKGEGDGRINILLMGDGGAGHDGPYLTDTMMVASLDPKTHQVALLSIPRDLWVNIPGHGYAKINATYTYGGLGDNGAALVKQTVSKILDIPIHYYALIDFSGFKTAVDAVGGVDVNVPKAISDPAYPCDDNVARNAYCPFYISAGPHHMDGALALKYSRSRESTSDFDRASRQQLILSALRARALSLSTLTNPIKISGLIDAVGDHVRTDLQLWEIEKLAGIVKDLDTTHSVNKVLDTSPGGYLVDSMINGQYVELPRGGSWEPIREFVHSIFTDSYLQTENARIEVQNGTLRAGLAAGVGNLLKAYNYNVVSMVTAAQQNHPVTVIYDYTGGKKPYTIQYLEQRFGVKSQRATPVVGDPDIRIILGNDYKGPVSAGQ